MHYNYLFIKGNLLHDALLVSQEYTLLIFKSLNYIFLCYFNHYLLANIRLEHFYGKLFVTLSSIVFIVITFVSGGFITNTFISGELV